VIFSRWNESEMPTPRKDPIDMALMLSALLVLLALAILLKACARHDSSHSDKIPSEEINKTDHPYAY